MAAGDYLIAFDPMWKPCGKDPNYKKVLVQLFFPAG
jgi:hypothetical protein